MKIGDKVVMNGKYYVSEENKTRSGRYAPSLGSAAERLSFCLRAEAADMPLTDLISWRRLNAGMEVTL